MFSTAIIIFREVFEIALILSVVMAATRGIKGRTSMALSAIGAGLAASCLVAFFASEISSFAAGMGQELFNAIIVFAATVMIGWTVTWMSSHAKEFSSRIKNLGKEINAGNAPLYSMGVVIALAMLREGSEIVLFTYSMLASGQNISGVLTGALIGLAGGSAVGLLLYFGIVSIPVKYIFRVTTWLLVLLAGGLASIGAGYLGAAGYFPALSGIVWDSSSILSENGVAGQALHILIGYSERPSQLQLIFYIITVATLTSAVLLIGRKKKG